MLLLPMFIGACIGSLLCCVVLGFRCESWLLSHSAVGCSAVCDCVIVFVASPSRTPICFRSNSN